VPTPSGSVYMYASIYSGSAGSEPPPARVFSVLVQIAVRSCTRFNKFRCYRSGLRHLLGEYKYGGIEADRQTNSSRQQAAADS
jgi:hypothetical protein